MRDSERLRVFVRFADGFVARREMSRRLALDESFDAISLQSFWITH